MIDLLSENKKLEQAVLVAVETPSQNHNKTQEYLDELEFLAGTIGIETQARFIQKMDKPHAVTFIGKGKLKELADFIEQIKSDVVIFDDDLSPSQVRNIERELEIKVYDRSLLILDIFLYRAQTAAAKTQVELARSQYLLPRLTNLWTHLERQRGGTGTRGGAGEKEIETDKRIIRNKITLLKERLAKIDKQRATQRKGRDRMVRVALAGYTNVGKSSMMNMFSKADVFAENKLFATIDSTVRKVVIDNIPFLLTDTVGFIRKLPHGLIECFKSTLDEISEADIILHVVDISNPGFEEHITVVKETLKEIGVNDKKILTVYNKIDEPLEHLFEPSEEEAITTKSNFDKLQASFLNTPDSVFVSIKDSFNLEQLKAFVSREVSELHYKIFPNYLK